MNDEREKAISELKDALKFAPDHIKYCMILLSYILQGQMRNLSNSERNTFFNWSKRYGKPCSTA